jgi:photosystem II stability/assembly factor-like uncharacterized protein
MKKTKTLVSIIFLLQLFFLSMPIHAQEGWYSINHVAKGNNMNSIYFVNDSVGYTVSDEGYLFRTTNKGINWTHTKLSSKSLNDITFKNNAGFVVGDSGKVFRTSDGINWTELTSGTTNKLRAVWFIDADTGYVFGDNSTIVKTINSGETWSKLNIKTGLTITDGALATPDFGMCATYEGLFLRTLDYGKTWQYFGFSGGSGNHFNSIFFPDTSVAYATGWGGDVVFVIKFKNKGNTNEIKWPPSNIPNSSFFVNADTGYVVGNRGAIVKTTDGGDSWKEQKNVTYSNLNSIFFLNNNIGYACGTDSTVVMTMDGGATWKTLNSIYAITLMNINFPTDQIGYSLGDGDILKTTNGGDDWKIYGVGIGDPKLYAFKGLYFLNADTGFVGNYGQVYKTTDGCQDWEVQDFKSQGVKFVESIKFYNYRIGIVAAGYKILKTTDGGQNWIVGDVPTATHDIAFIDTSNIILVGDEIHKSTDGGKNWRFITSYTYRLFNSVFFINNLIGCAVGENGIIVRTTDGGENWTIIPSNTSHNLWQVVFLSNSIGYIVGENGDILYTKDAGLSWSFQNSGIINFLSSISFINQTTGFIVGTEGTILKTTNGGITIVKENNKIIPSEFKLYQNYPNPFNPSTVISYQIPSVRTSGSIPVQLKIYDITGREIKTLINEVQSPGTYKIYFNGSNLSSGIYIYRITATSLETGRQFVKSAKMLLLK